MTYFVSSGTLNPTHSLTRTLGDAMRYLFTYWKAFNKTCHRYSSCEGEELKGFQGQRSKVNVFGTPFMGTVSM